jgi:pyruvate/2-oxoglutarate dehydrogenase complex dihydrolipoamide acyltransferase (E2) component
VKKGDRVIRGDLIAAVPEEKLGANVHASVEGKIAEVNERQICIRTE